MKKLSRAPSQSFARDRRGNVAVMFGLAVVPLTLFAGAAIDYSRAASLRARLQHAADSAVLAAALSPSGTLSGAQAAGQAAFLANFPDGGTVVISRPSSEPGAILATASAAVPTSLMQIAGIDHLDVGVTAKAQAFAGGSAIEVALVLDNTGSMQADMPALKNAASSLANTLFNAAAGKANFRMSVVPYVATVNPGKMLLSGGGYAMMDSTADAAIHGLGMRDANLATNVTGSGADCIGDWSGGGGPWVDPGKGGGSDKKTEIDIFEPVSRFANELFGIRPAFAFSETANTVPVLTGVTNPLKSSGAPGSGGEFLPDGFITTAGGAGVDNAGKGCDFLYASGKVNYFDLFNRIPPATKSGGFFGGWKGCVMARPEPYDATDDAPGADPANIGAANGRFVPYFAPDEADQFSPGAIKYANNWLEDGYPDPAAIFGAADRVLGDPTGTRAGRSDNNKWDFRYSDYSRTRSILKYNGVSKADVQDFTDGFGNHITTGPNANCPDEIQPLTASKAAVLAKINSLTHWAGGGTVTSEGLAWGWRTISPNAPYSLGAPYDAQKAQKIIVLMTDGRNDLITNGGGAGSVYSEYTAYGYLADGRMGATFAAATDYLNTRMSAVCANAKAKPGVSIYTVLFRETDPTITNLLRSCASSPDKAYVASNAAALETAFAQIAGGISQLRLTQ